MYQGAIVKSRCGRDRHRLFVIVGLCDDGRVLVADGKLHRLCAPKKKNLRHLAVLAAGDAAGTSAFSEDASLYAFLQDFVIDQ